MQLCVRAKKFFLVFLCLILISNLSILEVQASTKSELLEAREERMTLPIDSNSINNWPEGPQIGASSAILMDMNTHTILYSKNIEEKMYPASTTKILTCLLAIQNCELNENVTFSYDAVHDVPSDGSNMGMDAGEVITMEQALYGVLVGSANESASAVGEHVANKLGVGNDASSFVKLMNDKAKALGCVNSHFENANGLFDENHYTCAYDLALIGCEFFQNETLCKMSSTNRYHIAPTDTQPDDIWLVSKNQLFEGKNYAYSYLLGSKTGYTSQSRETLVSAASKDGMNLVCVIFMEESPYQFEDTVTLFQYGFENFKKVNLIDVEPSYSVTDDFIFSSSEKFFVNSNSMFSLDEDPYIILPKYASFDDVTTSIDYYPSVENNVFGNINYYYSGTPIGTCSMILNEIPEATDLDISHKRNHFLPSFFLAQTINEGSDLEQNFYFVNLKYLCFYIIITILALSFIFSILAYVSSFHFSSTHENDRRRKSRDKDRRIREKSLRKREREERKLNRRRRKEYKKRR